MAPQTFADLTDSLVIQLSSISGPGGFGFNAWNGNACCCWDNGATPIPDDSAYIADPTKGIIARIKAAGWNVSDVYIVADSAGEGVGVRAACEHADQITGVWGASGAPGVTTGAGSPADVACTPSQPFYWSHTHGTSDASAEPWTGTQAPNAGMVNACNSTIDSGDTVDQALAALGCAGQGSMTTTVGAFDFDTGIGGSESDLLVATGCSAGGGFQLIRMNGSGHAPPMNTTNWPAAAAAWMITHHR